MTEDIPNSDEDKKSEESAHPPQWLRAKETDFDSLDFEAPINGSFSADSDELSYMFYRSAQSDGAASGIVDTPASRAFALLGALTGMHFRPDERNEPYGPKLSLGDGSRSAIPSDFRNHVNAISALAQRTSSPVLRARLADVSWLLNRKQPNLATIAITAYVEIVERVRDGTLQYRSTKRSTALDHQSSEYLRRALQIGRAIGWEKPETLTVRNLAKQLRKSATENRDLVAIHWFSEIDLDFAVSDSSEVAAEIESVIVADGAKGDVHTVVTLWNLAARPNKIGLLTHYLNKCGENSMVYLEFRLPLTLRTLS